MVSSVAAGLVKGSKMKSSGSSIVLNGRVRVSFAEIQTFECRICIICDGYLAGTRYARLALRDHFSKQPISENSNDRNQMRRLTEVFV